MQSLTSSRPCSRASSRSCAAAPSVLLASSGPARFHARCSSREGASLLRRDVNIIAAGSLVAASSRRPVVAMASAAAPRADDLLVVGPGVLGGYAGKLWKDAHPGATVVGQTNSTSNHARLLQMGLQPRTRDQADGRKFANVLFSAPPSGSADYVADIKEALTLWDSTGAFVFTSSMSVCAVDDGGKVTDENCPLVPMGKAAGTDKLLGAEAAVLAAGGNVVRYVGLYHTQRGAHTFFFKAKEIQRPGSYVVNLLHYEDAASLAAAVLAAGSKFRGKAFIGCDDEPVTFQAMMEACVQSGVFSGEWKFTGDAAASGKGKQVSNATTRQLLGWKPKYSSFRSFMAAGGKDFYNTSGLF